MRFLSLKRIGWAFALGGLFLVAGCKSEPVGKPDPGRAEAARFEARVYPIEIAAENGPRALRAMHDVWFRSWNENGKAQTLVLSDQNFAISRRSHGVFIQGQPVFEVNGFLESVPGKPGRVTLNLYRTAVVNPDSAFEHRQGIENRAESLFVRQGMEENMAQLTPQFEQIFGTASGMPRVGMMVAAPSQIAAITPARSEFNLAVEKTYVTRNFTELQRIAMPLAQNGDMIAQRAIGYVLAEGMAGRDRAPEGIEMLKKAVAQGDRISEAVILINGYGTSPNLAGGIGMLRTEAAKGDLHALYLLAEIADAGVPVGPPDRTTAAKLFAVAARYGLEPAKERLARVPAPLRAEAEAFAETWPKAP